MNHFLSDWYYLSIRNIKQIWRPLLALIPSLFIPIFFFLVNSTALSAFSKVPGFPHVPYRDFIAPVALFTAVFFSAGNAGIELVQDISNGYFKKLIIMPISRLTIILGKLSEVAVQAFFQGLIVLVLLVAVGVRIHGGFTGAVAIFTILVLFAMAWSCIGMIAALTTQNARLVQSLFVVVFPLLYTTTSQAPLKLLPKTFATLAECNPVTYIIEAIRALVLTGWGGDAVWKGFVVAVSMFAILVTLTVASFRRALK
ncbi:MAG: ABC transporter permease [Capsulimonadaceae bacterium]